ncbi:MAG: hypothetical protein N3G75_06335 [Methanothrix sp.]|nr:hypothetical protein [Methanothrix sp.]MCX8207433.1 hypothetical protein [Methanothrix sp.]
MTVERVMLVLPNLNIIAGSDDTEKFEEWWLSEPLPVREIIELEWAGGDIGLAICSLDSGRHAIFRSEGGRRWSEVFRLPEGVAAFAFARIDYGWILLMTTDGWYETTNSGLNWQKISSDAPGCRRAIRISDSTLLAHDGSKVWRSLNLGRTWQISLDCESVAGGSLVYPALGGIYDLVLAGAGSKVMVSGNQGTSWNVDHTLPAHVSVANILCMDRLGDELPEFIMETLDHATGYFRVYYRDGRSAWIPRMDQRAIADIRNLGTVRVQRPGSTMLRTLCFSTATRWNSTRRTYEPSMYYSTDGGLTWRWIDIQKTHTSPGTPFVIEKFTYKVQVWASCHNYWRWEERYGYRKGLSWDASATVRRTIPNSCSFGVVVSRRFTRSVQAGPVLAARRVQSCTMRAAIRKTIFIIANSRLAARRTFSVSTSCRTAIAWRLTRSYGASTVTRRTQREPMWATMYLKGTAENSAQAGIIIVASKFEEIESDVERDFPQAWDITCTRRMRSLEGV